MILGGLVLGDLMYSFVLNNFARFFNFFDFLCWCLHTRQSRPLSQHSGTGLGQEKISTYQPSQRFSGPLPNFSLPRTKQVALVLFVYSVLIQVSGNLWHLPVQTTTCVLSRWLNCTTPIRTPRCQFRFHI